MTGVVTIGAAARAALAASGGRARPLAQFPDAPYFEAAGEIIWVGARLPARHPRAVLTAAPVARGATAEFDALPRQAWQRTLAPGADPRRVRAAARRLAGAVAALGEPRGFGALLAGRRPGFPLDLGVARVRSLVEAYGRDDAMAVERGSRALLGFGAGLTPSGDDLAGAALFGRRLVSSDGRWTGIGARLARAARERSHAISAALFADLAAGASFEPLHDLAEALAAGDDAAALRAARELAALGHSSGWDMLTGVLIGITGELRAFE